MKLFVFERGDWVPFTYTLVCAENEQEARSFLDDPMAYNLDNTYTIDKGVLGIVGD